MQELFNLRWYIQHLIDESESDDDDNLDNPRREDNWMLQTNWIFMKYVIFILYSMTPKQLNTNPIRSIIKAMPYHTHHTDEGESAKDDEESAKDEEESTTSTELSEDSISDTPTEATEDSKTIELAQVPTAFSRSRCDQDPSEDKSRTEFEPCKENREQITAQENKLLSTNFTVEIQNRKVEELIIYSLDEQIFKFKVTNGHKESQKTSNSDKFTNLELWGVNVDVKSYKQKWTNHGIFQHMGFYYPTENPCVMRSENLKTKSSEYIG